MRTNLSLSKDVIQYLLSNAPAICSHFYLVFCHFKNKMEVHYLYKIMYRKPLCFLLLFLSLSAFHHRKTPKRGRPIILMRRTDYSKRG